MTDRETFLPVPEAYDRWAAAYDCYPNPMLAAAARILDRAAGLAAGRDVVEFGCGTTGFDLSDGMLAEARRKLPGAILFRHDITAAVPLPDRSAGLVLFALVLEHIATPALPLAEAARLLRPGGVVVVAEIHPELAGQGVAAHFVDAGGVVRMPTFAHDLEAWRAAFETAGLAVQAMVDWRARDVAPQRDPKVWKRGPDALVAIEFRLVTRA